MNESSGASIDTVVMARQVTWIARRMSPLVRGVYTRDSSNGTHGQPGTMHGVEVTKVDED